MPRLTPSQQRELLRLAQRAARGTRRGTTRGGIFRRLASRLGPLGELIGIVGDILSGGRGISRQSIEDAIRILTEQGFSIQPGPPGAPPTAPPTQPRQVPTVPTVPTGPSAPPARPGRAPPAEIWPEEHGVQVLPTRIRGAFTDVPEDVTGVSPWLLFPQSSNVHAAMYDYENKILYVQFREAGKPIGYKDGISICSGKAYKIGIRADVPGPIYSYGGAGRPVPESLWNELARTRSAGKFVWDKLRVCGSTWQHKFPYTLTDVPAGQSVPRKSTRRGLRVRTVPTVGLGRRGGRQSTLPERIR